MKGRLTIFLTVVVVLVALTALNAASYVRVESEGEQESRPDRSTLNAGPTGTRALFEYLQQTGRDAVRWTRPPDQLSAAGDAARPATFVIVGQARRAVEDEEAEAILRWVRDGGRLVLIDRSPATKLVPAAGGWGVSSEVFDSPDLSVRPEDPEAMTGGAKPVAPSQPTPLVRDVAEVRPSRFASRLHIYRIETEDDSSASGLTAPKIVGVMAPPRQGENHSNETDDAARDGGAAAEEEEAGGSAEASESDTPPPPAAPTENPLPAPPNPAAPVSHLPDWREGEGSLLVDYAYGRGRVVLLSDPYLVSNAGIGLSDNLFLAAGVVGGEGGRVLFDEYHQGYGAGRNDLLAYFAGTPILWMFGQAGVVALAVAWTRGRRFARPLPAPEPDRRSKLEFVASMAELQLRARAYDLAVENVYARTRRSLARYGGARADAPVAELAARVAARSGRDRARLEKLLRDCEDSIAGERTTARRALALVRDLRALERDLGLLMRSREMRQAGRPERTGN